MKKEMLINVTQPEECRIAIIEDGVLEDLYVERASQESYVGNIYKGKIVNIEPSIQAAFVDFGIGRNGFLHVSDVDPVYYKHLLPKDVLAQLEAEENGGSGPDRAPRNRDRGRDRDRGRTRDRSPEPRAMTSFLEPTPPAPEPVTETFSDEDNAEFSTFGAGLIDDGSAEVVYDADSSTSFSNQDTEESEYIEEVSADEDEPEDDDDEPVTLRVSPTREALPPPPPPAEPDDPELSGFGAGLLEDEEFPSTNTSLDVASESAGYEVIEEQVEIVELESVEEEALPAEPVISAGEESEESGEALESALEPEAKKAPRTRRPRKKPEGEETEARPEGEGEAKRSRTRKPKKKSDEDTTETPDEGESGPEPRTMPGAERRTSPPGDEPELESSFGAGLDEGFESVPDSQEPLTDDASPFSETSDSTLAEQNESDTNDDVVPFFDAEVVDNFDVSGPNDRFQPGQATREEQPPARGPRRGHSSRRPSEPAPIAAGTSMDDEGEGTFGEEMTAPAVTSDTLDDDEDFSPPGFNDDPDAEANERPRGRGGRQQQRGRGGDRRSGPGRNGATGNRSAARDRGLPRLPIEKIFKKGQEVIVQVIKEGIGTKGPTLSTYISIAGRYLVLMPSLNRVGVSRKIEDHDARRRLREIMTDLSPPPGVGFIVRTAAIDRDPQELQNDLTYLLRLWQVVVRRIQKVRAPVEIYRESDMITRTIRDNFKGDIDNIYVDDPVAYQHASEFMQIVMPRYANRIKLHDSPEPLFHRFRLEDELSKINQKRIDLPLGGSIIIEQTEALVAIDVNSGNFRAENNAEETAFQMNLIAAREIARQLRLRDLGGVIVNDFIDMRDEKHRRKVEDALRDALTRDKARTKILRISQFGIIEMTRQRIQPSLKKRVYNECSHCKGTGFVKTNETLGIEVMRILQLATYRATQGVTPVTSVQVTVHLDVAFYLLNKKRRDISAMEERANVEVMINGVPNVSPDTLEFKCFDSNGNEVRLTNPGPPPRMFGPGGRPPRGYDRRQPVNLD